MTSYRIIKHTSFNVMTVVQNCTLHIARYRRLNFVFVNQLQKCEPQSAAPITYYCAGAEVMHAFVAEHMHTITKRRRANGVCFNIQIIASIS